MKTPRTYESTVLETIEDAAQAITELQEEMGEWRDNMSNANMDHLPKYEQVEQAADELENADMERKGEELRSALETLAEGRAFKAGCPKHVAGQKCKRCGWSGMPLPLVTVEELVEYAYGKCPKNRFDATEVTVATLGHGNGSTFWSMPADASFEIYQAQLEEARRYRSGQEVKAERQNEGVVRFGRRIPDETELEAFPGAEDLAAKKLTFRVAKKRQSRADRLGGATGRLEAALDAIDEFIAAHKTADEDDRLLDLEHAASELREGLDELQGVEFPGMFG